MTKTTKTTKTTADPKAEAPKPQPIILGAIPKARKPRGQSSEVLLRWATLDGMAEDAGPLTFHEHALGHEDNPEAEGDTLYVVGIDAEGKPTKVRADAEPPEGFTPNVLAHWAKAFPITGEQMGVAESSVPVTIAAWAKDRGIAHSVPTKYGTPVVVLS